MRKGPIPTVALAVENLTVGRMEPVRFIEEAAAAGFGAVGLALATASPVPLQHEIVGRAPVISAIRRALRDTGMKVFDVEAFVLAPGASVVAYRPVLELGAELGAGWISVIGSPVTGEPVDAGARRALFAALCEQAARLGLGVGVECMVYRDIRTVDDALDLLAGAGSARAGIILDVLHLHRAGTTAARLAAIPPRHVAWAQLCDVAPGPPPALADLPQEARHGRLHPGHGVAALREFMDALPDGTALAVETPVAAEADMPTAARLRAAAQHAEWFIRSWADQGAA